MYNLSKQQQSTAIIQDKLGFQVFEQLAKTQSTSCSPNLPFALSHPQKRIYTIAKNIFTNSKKRMPIHYTAPLLVNVSLLYFLKDIVQNLF